MAQFLKKTNPLTLLVTIITLLVFAIFGGLTGLALAEGSPEPPAVSQQADPHAGLDISSAAESAPALSAPLQDDDPAKKCAGCHSQVLDSWQGSPHHEAFSNDPFQQAWETANKNPNCLQCHTTNFSPATGTYEAEGISCVECHGEVPADHPNTPVNLDIANTVCKDCHTVTFAEFRASVHHDKGLECTSCHYAHENGLRLGDQISQCTNCHTNQLDDFAHESHFDAGLECRNCHGYVDPNQAVPIDGLVPTGHDFRENTRSCVSCHENITLSADGNTGQGGDGFSAEANQQASLRGAQATLRVAELEAAYKTLVLQNRNSNLMGILEGGIGGLAIGGVALWLYSRRRRTLTKNGDGDQS